MSTMFEYGSPPSMLYRRPGVKGIDLKGWPMLRSGYLMSRSFKGIRSGTTICSCNDFLTFSLFSFAATAKFSSFQESKGDVGSSRGVCSRNYVAASLPSLNLSSGATGFVRLSFPGRRVFVS